ncbi:MAG: Rpn family recombination-promoting nuclease/putative transposase [Anaerostipes hadrus]|mgnify:FL=1|nr:Rpn family recombination-promoting nuclease/putative transposase [uncultured Anaerostipes sp.]MCI6009356.1 Rpn family recombination-promoting nuclease/putative transposase [Anaerostipes hadrus]
MAEKDKVEKLLEDYPDVFADIINVLIYDGKQVVKPEELRTTNVQSQYKASDDVLHEEERDILKEWTKGKDYKVFFGIENQTTKDRKMPLRVIAYDGASYRSQMLKKNQKDFCKVITLVLHFGNRRWEGDKELQEIIKKQSGEEEWFQNYKLNVVDIAYLTEKQIKMFRSDFGIIADYFVKRRKGYKTIEDHQPIKHVDEVLKFMKIFAEDNRFLKLNVKKDEKGEVTMCTILDAVEQKGINKGKKLGYKNGQDEILKLVKILIASNRLKDIDRIYEDESYREQLIKQYKISN